MALDCFPQTVALRGGAPVTLTPLQPADSGALLAFYGALPEEDRQFLRDDVTSPEWAAGFLRKVEHQDLLSLIARQGNRVVGEGTLYRSGHGWTRHVGELRVAVDASLRRKGLGTALASALVRLATDLGIEKLIIELVDNQLGARRTFEKLGFHREATLPHHVMDSIGVKRDLLIMANDVSQIWAAMEALNQDYAPHFTE